MYTLQSLLSKKVHSLHFFQDFYDAKVLKLIASLFPTVDKTKLFICQKVTVCLLFPLINNGVKNAINVILAMSLITNLQLLMGIKRSRTPKS